MELASLIGVMAKSVPKREASASVPRPVPKTKMGERRNSCARSAKNIHMSASKHMYPTMSARHARSELGESRNGREIAARAMNGKSVRKMRSQCPSFFEMKIVAMVMNMPKQAAAPMTRSIVKSAAGSTMLLATVRRTPSAKPKIAVGISMRTRNCAGLTVSGWKIGISRRR